MEMERTINITAKTSKKGDLQRSQKKVRAAGRKQ